MEWTRYKDRSSFARRDDPTLPDARRGVRVKGDKWSDAPGPGAVWAIPEDARGTFAYVRSYLGHRYEITGERP